jgi:hypothetical protein
METGLPGILEDFFQSCAKRNEKIPASYLIIPLAEPCKKVETSNPEVLVHVPFKGSEIYLLQKAFIDSGGAPGETYKSLFEKTGSHLGNKNQKGFSTESLQKCSDKVDYEAKENVKRFLQKMIRNIDSY